MSNTLYLVFRNPGPSWVRGRTSREQPQWNEHAVFMDRLFADGRIVLAGPYLDYSRILIVLQARDAEDASGLLLDDPWTRSGILVTSEVIEWTVFLDSRGPDGMKSRSAPEGWHTVTPRIVVDDAKQLVDFLERVFESTGKYRQDGPSEIRIGDSIIMITSAGIRRPMPGFLYVYVTDADATYRRALAAGARSLEEPVDTPYGDRRAMIEDRWGNTWQIATPIGAPPAAR